MSNNKVLQWNLILKPPSLREHLLMTITQSTTNNLTHNKHETPALGYNLYLKKTRRWSRKVVIVRFYLIL